MKTIENITNSPVTLYWKVVIDNNSLIFSNLETPLNSGCTLDIEGSEKEIATTWSWLKAYLNQKPYPFPFLVSWNQSNFHSQVWNHLQTIPFGTTYSYSEVASALGSPRAARAVGQACHRNPFPFVIPCHRVITKNQSLGGFALDLEIKQELLRFESLQIL